MSVACARYKAQGQPCPKAGTPTYTSLQDSAVTFLVQQEELGQKAKKLGVTVTQKDIDKQVDQIKKQYFQGSKQKLDAALKKDGITLSELEQYELRPNLLGQDVHNKVTANIKVSDAAAQKYYTQNKKSFTTPKTREVRHILVNSKTLADTIETKLKNGASFAALAKKYSKDTGSAAQGGKLASPTADRAAPATDGRAVRQGRVLAQDEPDLAAGAQSVTAGTSSRRSARSSPRTPDLPGGQGADPGEPRLAAEADGVAGLAREDDEGLQGKITYQTGYTPATTTTPTTPAPTTTG